MTLDEYQILTSDTVAYSGHFAQQYCTVQLGAEAGEVLAARGKFLRGDFGVEEYERRTVKEIGGVLWYCARLLAEINVTMEDCAAANLEELRSRFERGVIKGDGDDR